MREMVWKSWLSYSRQSYWKLQNNFWGRECLVGVSPAKKNGHGYFCGYPWPFFMLGFVKGKGGK